MPVWRLQSWGPAALRQTGSPTERMMTSLFQLDPRFSPPVPELAGALPIRSLGSIVASIEAD